LLALEAELVLVSSRGERTVPLSDYFLGYRKTLLRTFELIKTIRIPLENIGVVHPVGARHASPLHAPKQQLQAMYKIAKRGHDDISTVMAAFHLELENDNITNARLAFGGVAAIPIRALETEQALIGQPWNRATIEAAKKVLVLEFQPISDARASASYRARIIPNLLEKFWLKNAGVNA
jgi:xanthine dehydrogenase small subunit